MQYYEVSLPAKKHWKKGLFTYSFAGELKIGTLVLVSFGRQKKMGMIASKVEKPDFGVKKIESIYDFLLTKETVAFMNWYGSYYSAERSRVMSQFFPNYLTFKPSFIDFGKREYNSEPSLSSSQLETLKNIEAIKTPTVLHGVTGAGKTRIYIKLLLDQLKQGKNGLLLYPEIALTPQIINELEKYAIVLNFHSQLKPSERSKLWYTLINSKDPLIIAGPRSAIFLPHKNLGIIIIDEPQESSYKQESDVRYQSIYVCGGLAKAHKAKLLLGSATPPITETYQIIKNGGNLVCLHEKAINLNQDKEVEIVSQKDRSNFKIHQMISDKLIKKIETTLNNKKQVLLFLNRRGTSKLVICTTESCEWHAECSNCELPLTYHHDFHRLICHTCGTKQTMPNSCPVCNGEIQQKSAGNKAIYEDISKLFPLAKIARFDSDNDTSESFDALYPEVVSGKIDIIIGTQQMIKGIDLPKLGLVGILSADLSLHFPDFSSDEKTFQLITQAIGRVGRGHTRGSVIIQTFQPNSSLIKMAANEDWHSFNDTELSLRHKHKFPPFNYYAKIIFRHKIQEKALQIAKVTKVNLEKSGLNIDGPLPSFYAKRGKLFYFQLLVSSNSRRKITDALAGIDSEALIDLDPISLL